MNPARAIRARALRATGLMHPDVLILDVTHRCTSRCAGCAFREAEPGELPVSRWLALAEEARGLGFRELLLTGGEPLAHPELDRLLPGFAAALPVVLMTNGLALRKHADLVRAHTREVYVSWDAVDDDTYARLRGVRGFTAVRDGVRALEGHRSHARVTVWAENVDQLDAIRDGARAAGFGAMSLLAADTSSGGFGERNDDRGTPARPDQLPALADFLARAAADPFVQMSAFARDRVLRLSRGDATAPPCLAPWTSGVVDPTGHWRHCFFLPSSADTAGGLRAAMRGARPERRALHVESEPTCARCVCWRA